MDPALEESARSLGLSARQTFFRVVLPQLRPALLGGLLLVVLDTLVEFDAFVALKYQTFSVNVYAQYQLSFSASGAAALSFFSIVLCCVLLVGESRLRRGANYSRVSHGARRAPVRATASVAGRRSVLAGLALIVAISLGIPVGVLIYWFTQSSQAGFSGATANLHYLLPATLTSVGLGVGSAVLALVFAVPVASLVVRYRSRLTSVLERSTYLSFALPDLVAAIALAYAREPLRALCLRERRAARVRRRDPVRALRRRRDASDARPDRAGARGLGPVARATARCGRCSRLTLPLARPGLAAAGVLVFAFVLGDLSTAQVLLPPDLYTLGTEFQANSSTVAFAAAAPFAAVLVTAVDGRDVRADEPLRPGSRARGALTMAELQLRGRRARPTAPAPCSRTSICSSPRGR